MLNVENACEYKDFSVINGTILVILAKMFQTVFMTKVCWKWGKLAQYDRPIDAISGSITSPSLTIDYVSYIWIKQVLLDSHEVRVGSVSGFFVLCSLCISL